MKVTMLLNSGEKVTYTDEVEELTLSYRFDEEGYDSKTAFGLGFKTDGEPIETGYIKLSRPDGEPLSPGFEVPEELETHIYDWVVFMRMMESRRG